jgi:FkbM family methyltransferase
MTFTLPPVLIDNQRRADMTARCRDCDAIPKVADAGRVGLENGEQIQIMHNGIRVAADRYYGEWMTDIISRLRGHHEPQEEIVFHEIMKHIGANATMLELGGFWSYYSLWFLAGSGTRRSIVLEPDPNHLKVGQKNAELNGRTIEFVQASVGEHSSSPRPFQTESAGEVLIRQVSVPDLLEEKGVPYLDILHSDTQGAETGIIASCEELLRSNRIGFCIVSTHSHHIGGDILKHQKCLAMMRDFGGRILIEHDVQESFSGDGLIVAYFGQGSIEWNEPRISLNRYSTSLFRNPIYDYAQHVDETADRGMSRISENDQLKKALEQRLAEINSLTDKVKRLEAELDICQSNHRQQHNNISR